MDAENTLHLELSTGPVTIKLRPDLAPQHVVQIKELARQKTVTGSIHAVPQFAGNGAGLTLEGILP